MGASDEILQLHLRAWEGMLRQFTEARTTDVPIGRQGMYYKDFSVQSDWMHHGEALRTFNVLALSAPALPAYQKRARAYAAVEKISWKGSFYRRDIGWRALER